MSSFKTLNGRDYQCARMNYWNSDFFIRCGVHDGYDVEQIRSFPFEIEIEIHILLVLYKYTSFV
jgi:hypothetical protein